MEKDLSVVLAEIKDGDERMFSVVERVLTYLRSVYQDKYFEPCREVDPNAFTMSARYGKGFNMGSVVKYVHRYLSEGYGKSSHPDDLLKALHFILIEMKRISP